MDDETSRSESDGTEPNEPVREFMPATAAPVEPVVIKKQPTWTYFLTPISILIGAGIVAGSIWWSTGRDEDEPATVAAMPDMDAVSEAPASASPEAQTGDTLLSAFTQYANSIGLDEQGFRSCLSKQSNVELITAQYQRGSSLGVTGTPTFYINGKQLTGDKTLDVLSAEIDPLL